MIEYGGCDIDCGRDEGDSDKLHGTVVAVAASLDWHTYMDERM